MFQGLRASIDAGMQKNVKLHFGKRGFTYKRIIRIRMCNDKRLLISLRIGNLVTFTIAMNTSSLHSNIAVYTITVRTVITLPF